jgi:hypothetical protein
MLDLAIDDAVAQRHQAKAKGEDQPHRDQEILLELLAPLLAPWQ